MEICGQILGDGDLTAANILINGKVTFYNGQSTAGNGFPGVLASITVTASADSIVTTSLLSAAEAALYRVSVYLCTQAPGTGNVVTTIGWTDSIGVKSSTSSPSVLTLTADNQVDGIKVIEVANGTDITYATTYTGTGAYNINIILERLT